MRKVVLSGYMGSGKTVVGAELGRVLNIPYLDLDKQIETTQGKSVAEIFSSDGEVRFRKLEHSTLKALLENDDEFILSLGGGTPCYANNHELIGQSGATSFYLKTSITTLIGRLKAGSNRRPLIQNLSSDELPEFMAKHLFDRSYFYNQADHVILTDGKSPGEIAREIATKLT